MITKWQEIQNDISSTVPRIPLVMQLVASIRKATTKFKLVPVP